MILKIQAPIPGEQPNQGAGGTGIMAIPFGPRVGVVYIEATVTKAAGGSIPVLTDVLSPTSPITVKVGGNAQITRLASELIALNRFQSRRAAGSVEYFQTPAGGVATRIGNTNDAGNTVAPVGVANGNSVLQGSVNAALPITAIFQIPIYFAEYWRKDLNVAENMAWPTVLQNGNAAMKQITVECPLANNGGNVFSGHQIRYWYDYDEARAAVPPAITKKGRFTKLYAAAGDINFQFTQKDLLMQFSILLAANDSFTKLVVKKNGKVLRDVTKARNDQTLLDHELNDLALATNRFDLVFDVNDDPLTGLPLMQNDTFEVTATLASVAGAANAVLLTESWGYPD